MKPNILFIFLSFIGIIINVHGLPPKCTGVVQSLASSGSLTFSYDQSKAAVAIALHGTFDIYVNGKRKDATYSGPVEEVQNGKSVNIIKPGDDTPTKMTPDEVKSLVNKPSYFSVSSSLTDAEVEEGDEGGIIFTFKVKDPGKADKSQEWQIYWGQNNGIVMDGVLYLPKSAGPTDSNKAILTNLLAGTDKTVYSDAIKDALQNGGSGNGIHTADNKKKKIFKYGAHIMTGNYYPRNVDNAYDEYYNLLTDYEYDRSIEQAREEKAIRLLKREKRNILKAKHKVNNYGHHQSYIKHKY